MATSKFLMKQNERGAIVNLKIKDDISGMNWVIDPNYLKQVGYDDQDKLFGEFTITVNGIAYNSIEFDPKITNRQEKHQVGFEFDDLKLTQVYENTGRGLKWIIKVDNKKNSAIRIDNFGIWTSLAYVMFRDKDIKRNANQSAAVFSSISPNFTKIAAVRRDNTGPNLGIYQISGEMMSIGTYNEYSNRFFENVSPSLDGLLFHQMILAGGYKNDDIPENDWIYPHAKIEIEPNSNKIWEFYLEPFNNQKDFYKVAMELGHPKVEFSPLVTNSKQKLKLSYQDTNKIKRIVDLYKNEKDLVLTDLTKQLNKKNLIYDVHGLGEHQIIFEFADGKKDMVVFNKMDSIRQLLRNRVDFISKHSYQGSEGEIPYSFTPISNQGESLGKLTFVIQACLLDSEINDIAGKIAQVESSAVNYVRQKWFIDGDFKRPRKLYGDFYRVMDLEYIAHLFYMLSKCDDRYLKLNKAKDYLLWAGEVFDVRINSKLHDNQRGKEESQMLGQYFLYVEDLLKDLEKNGLHKEYEEILSAWKLVTDRVDIDSRNLRAAMTEHFFDNAGFGPAAGALAVSGHVKGSCRYGELLKANIGFSNDFRAQSPDRWWEALSYMMHALWGGVTAAAAVIVGHELGDLDLLQAGYRGTVALLYMYDSNATATNRILKPGEAASTYSVAGPNLNRPDLSRNRFGQSIFASDGGIFSRLFPDGYTGEDDWDMGEELVAYLNGFGQSTYIAKDKDGGLIIINGSIVESDEEYITIKSDAPYPKHLIDLNTKRIIRFETDIVKCNRHQFFI